MYENWSAKDIRGQVKSNQALKNYQKEIEKQQALEMQRLEQIEQAQKEKENASFIERFGQTIGDVVGQIGVGVSKSIEGGVDFASGIVGGIGGIFDKDFQEQVKKNIEYDWTYNNIQKPLADATKYSYINDASETVQNIVRGVPNAVGQMLPAIATGPMALPTLMVSSAGNGIEESFKDGADYNTGLLYGSIVGGVEGAIEKISGGMAKNVFGKGLADKVFEKVASNAYAKKGVQYLLDAGGEAFEEYLSTTINPYIKRMTYDPDAELSTSEERLESALIGGLASIGYRSTIGKVGEKQRDVIENLRTVQETEQQANQEWGKGKLTEAQNEKYNQRIERAYNNAMYSLKRMTPDKRTKFIERNGLGNLFDNDGNLKINLYGNNQSINASQNSINNGLANEINTQIQSAPSEMINNTQEQNFSQNDALTNSQALINAKFSIKKDANGKEYVNIDTDQHLFDGKTTDEMKAIAGEYFKNILQGKNVDRVDINRRSQNEYLNSKYTRNIKKQNSELFTTKMRLTPELINALKTAQFIKLDSTKHLKSFNKDGYYTYNVDFTLNGKTFNGKLLVAKNGDKKVFYDIVTIKEKGLSSQRQEKTAPLQTKNANSLSIVEDNPSNNSIRNNIKKINQNEQNNQNIFQNGVKPTQNNNNVPKTSISKNNGNKSNIATTSGKPNHNAYSPKLWGKESSLLLQPTTHELTAEQKETLSYFTKMNTHRNFALVCITDDMQSGVEGFYHNGVIYVSRTAKNPLQVTLMHEMTHHLENTKAYNEYAKFIFDDLESENSVLKRINDVTGNNWTVEELRERYTEMYTDGRTPKQLKADVDSEIIATYTSEFMFTDLYTMARMGAKNKSLLNKFYNWVRSVGEYFVNKDNKSKQEKSVRKFLKQAESLYKQALENSGQIIRGHTLLATDDKEEKTKLSTTKDKNVDNNAQNSVNSNKEAENEEERASETNDTNETENSTSGRDVRKESSDSQYLVWDKELPVSFDARGIRPLPGVRVSEKIGQEINEVAELMYIEPNTYTQSNLKWHAEKENLNLYFVKLKAGTRNFYVLENDNLFIDENATEKDFVDILNVEKPIIRNLDPNKIAHISQERWDKFLKWHPDAYITRIPIQQFLDMTTDSYVTQRQINAVSRQISQDANDVSKTSSEFMYLEIDFNKNKVLSHEGRHRATSLLNAGNTYIDIFVIPVDKTAFESRTNISIEGQYADNKYSLGLVRAQNKQLANAIKATFLNDDANIKYSLTKGEHNKAMANYRQDKVYSRKESEQIIEDVISNELNLNEYYGILRAKDREQVVTKLFENLNSVKPSERRAELEKIADSLINSARYQSMYESFEQMDMHGYNAIKSYMHKLDLSGLKGEIRHRYDDGAKTIYLHWSAGQNKGINVEDAIAELREQGVIINANNDVDAFFELVNKYNALRADIKAEVNEFKANDFAHESVADLKQRIVNELEQRINEAGTKSAIARLKEYYNNRLQRLIDDRRTAYFYSRELVRLKTAYDRFKALKNKTADKLLVPIVDELVSAMQKTMTYTGNLNKNLRNILRNEFMPIHKQLIELSEDIDNPYVKMLADIASRPSNENLTPNEIHNLVEVFENAIHLSKNYDKVFWENKNQSETELAERAIQEVDDMKTYVPKGWFFDKVVLNDATPQRIFEVMGGYDKNSFMSQAYQGIIDAEIKKQTLLSEIDYELQTLNEKYTKEMKGWSKNTVDFKEGQITPAQQITLVMSWERPQARQHMENGGVVVLNEKYVSQGNFVRAQNDGVIKAVVTQADIDTLKNNLTEAQKEYIKVAEKIFDELCRNAKYETDMAIRGVSNVENGKYIPIEVVDDELAKRLGGEFDENATIIRRVQSVYTYSANMSTKQGAKNAIAIDDITRVINRHTQDMANYYGYGLFINSFNRIMNKRIGETTLRNVLNKTNSNFVPYVQTLFKDIQGIGKGRDNVQKVLDTVRNYAYKGTLGLNVKSWSMQFISILSARGGGLGYNDLFAGIGKFISHKNKTLAELDKVNALAHARFRDGFNTDFGRIKNERGYLGKLDDVTDKLISPMQTIDKWVNGIIWEACKIKTNNNLDKASELFTKTLIETQANWSPAFRPQIMRSQNALMKFLTMYMSEPLQLFSRMSSSIMENQLLMKLRKSNRYKNDAEYKKQIDERFNLARRNLWVQTSNVLLSMSLSTMIAILFKELLKTAGDDDDEKMEERILPEFLSNIFGMFPIVRDMYSIIEGYDITNSAYTGLTNITNAGKNMWKLAELLISGKQYDSTEIASIIRQTANGLTQTFGIPLRNAEKYVKAFIDMFSPETAYKWNSMFKTRSMSAYYEALGKAQNNESLQTTIFKTMLRDKGVGVDSADGSNELLRLYNAGVNALPKSVATSLTYNDEKIELTQSQYKQVQNEYNKASTQAQKLIASKEYENANDEIKGKALKSLYDYYYEQALLKITNEELSKFGMFAQAIDVYKLSIYTAEISAIKQNYNQLKETNNLNKTLKEMIIDYINSLKLTAVQKYMLLGYAGYKNANGVTQVQNYINNLTLSKEQKEQLYSMSGY